MAEGRLPRGAWLSTDVPQRLDRLPWSRWHVRLVVALGITRVLDGLEVTIVGSVAAVLSEPGTMRFSASRIGLAASAYLLDPHRLPHARLPATAATRPYQVQGAAALGTVAHVLLRRHLRRTVLGLSLMVAQAFAYDAVFLTFALALGRFYGVASDRAGLYLLPFAAGNLLGPLLLGRLCDTAGRRPMIALSYAASGALLALTGYAFARGWLTVTTQTSLWCAVFFVASAAASSAYLKVSELFPVELRGLAIAVFFAAGTAAGGVAGAGANRRQPAPFGATRLPGATSDRARTGPSAVSRHQCGSRLGMVPSR